MCKMKRGGDVSSITIAGTVREMRRRKDTEKGYEQRKYFYPRNCKKRSCKGREVEPGGDDVDQPVASHLASPRHSHRDVAVWAENGHLQVQLASSHLPAPQQHPLPWCRAVVVSYLDFLIVFHYHQRALAHCSVNHSKRYSQTFNIRQRSLSQTEVVPSTYSWNPMFVSQKSS